jgi:hypothetical protein
MAQHTPSSPEHTAFRVAVMPGSPSGPLLPSEDKPGLGASQHRLTRMHTSPVPQEEHQTNKGSEEHQQQQQLQLPSAALIKTPWLQRSAGSALRALARSPPSPGTPRTLPYPTSTSSPHHPLSPAASAGAGGLWGAGGSGAPPASPLGGTRGGAQGATPASPSHAIILLVPASPGDSPTATESASMAAEPSVPVAVAAAVTVSDAGAWSAALEVCAAEGGAAGAAGIVDSSAVHPIVEEEPEPDINTSGPAEAQTITAPVSRDQATRVVLDLVAQCQGLLAQLHAMGQELQALAHTNAVTTGVTTSVTTNPLWSPFENVPVTVTAAAAAVAVPVSVAPGGAMHGLNSSSMNGGMGDGGLPGHPSRDGPSVAGSSSSLTAGQRPRTNARHSPFVLDCSDQPWRLHGSGSMSTSTTTMLRPQHPPSPIPHPASQRLKMSSGGGSTAHGIGQYRAASLTDQVTNPAGQLSRLRQVPASLGGRAAAATSSASHVDTSGASPRPRITEPSSAVSGDQRGVITSSFQDDIFSSGLGPGRVPLDVWSDRLSGGQRGPDTLQAQQQQIMTADEHSHPALAGTGDQGAPLPGGRQEAQVRANQLTFCYHPRYNAQ